LRVSATCFEESFFAFFACDEEVPASLLRFLLSLDC
jgi:hypothetical protein